MPIYEYVCQDCQARFETIISAAKADTVVCPTCQGKTRRLMSAPFGVRGEAMGLPPGYSGPSFTPPPSTVT